MAVASTGLGQQNQQDPVTQDNQRQVLSGAGSFLEINLESPRVVRVGETYRITASLANRSNDLDLSNIYIELKTSGPVDVQESRLRTVARNEGSDSSNQSP